MSLSFDLIEDRRRAARRARSYRRAQMALLGLAGSGVALALVCGLFAYVFANFFFP